MIQLVIMALLPKSLPMAGRAKLIELPIKVVINEVVMTVNKAVFSSDLAVFVQAASFPK